MPSSKCNMNGYYHYQQCFCFSQFEGQFCQDKRNKNIFQINDKCHHIIERLNNLLNINSNHYENDDDEFPRLTGDSIGNSNHEQELQDTDGWIRMHDITKDFQIFGDKIQPQQVLQGQLGNCYFLAALSSLANIEDGIFIKDIFQTQTDNDNHIYVTKWIINGKPYFVAVDDWLPQAKNEPNTPAFLQIYNGNIFWAAILEKSWAKIHGNYMEIQGGSTDQIWEALYQGKQEHLKNDLLSPDQIYETIKDFLLRNYPVSAYTFAETEFQEIRPEEQKQHLVPSHAYSVLKAIEVQINENEIQKLLLVFNPWNREKWLDNPWGSNGKKWTEEMKQQYNVQENQGSFYLTPEDYKDQFKATMCSQMFRIYDIKWQDVPFIKGHVKYNAKFTVNQNQQYLLIKINEISNRFTYQMNCKAPFHYMRNSLKVTSPDQKRYQDDKNLKQIELFEVDEGEYQIELGMMKTSYYIKYFTITLYALKDSVSFVEKQNSIINKLEKQCKNNCSNQGKCDQQTGKCICKTEYTGEDCSIKKQVKCPNDCNGNGICQQGICICDKGFMGKDCKPCEDLYDECQDLMEAGDCEENNMNVDFMKEFCQKTCGNAGYKQFECYLEDK